MGQVVNEAKHIFEMRGLKIYVELAVGFGTLIGSCLRGTEPSASMMRTAKQLLNVQIRVSFIVIREYILSD